MKQDRIMEKMITSAFILILFSCNNHEDIGIGDNLPKIQEYSMSSMFYPSGMIPTVLKVKLKYDKNNQITQRIGHGIVVPQATGYSYTFYEDIADTVRYFEDSIIITKQLLSDKDFTSINEYKRKLIINDDLIIKEIYFEDYYGVNSYDTLLYSYNSQNQVEEIVHIQTSSNWKNHKFNYDDKGNVSLITSQGYRNDDILTRDTIWFLDYDNSPNLLRNLGIFQECFYRSLSTNNFRKYIYKSYSVSDSKLTTTEERNWEFLYDENNYPIY